MLLTIAMLVNGIRFGPAIEQAHPMLLFPHIIGWLVSPMTPTLGISIGMNVMLAIPSLPAGLPIGVRAVAVAPLALLVRPAAYEKSYALLGLSLVLGEFVQAIGEYPLLIMTLLTPLTGPSVTLLMPPRLQAQAILLPGSILAGSGAPSSLTRGPQTAWAPMQA